MEYKFLRMVLGQELDESKEYIGVVDNFWDWKGYGLISCEDFPGEEIFVSKHHVKEGHDIPGEFKMGLKEGDVVRMNLERSYFSNKLEARNVRSASHEKRRIKQEKIKKKQGKT